MITSFFIYLLQSSICIILFYGFYHLVLRNENFFQLNRIYLIGTTLLSLTIPYFQINLNHISSETGVIYLGLDDYLVNGVTNVITNTNTSWWTTENILFAIYSIGCMIFLMKILTSIFYVIKLKSNSDVQKIQNYYLVETNISHPVFSFFNMIFWNKELKYTETEAEQILLHERVHVDQKHSLDILLLECIHALLWFNPFLYLYKKSLRNTHEFIADYQLFEKHHFQIQYVDLLMKEAKIQRGNSLPVVHTFFNNQLKKRLIMIKNSNKHSNKIKLLGCLPILAMLIFTFSLESNVNAQTSSTKVDVPEPKAGFIYVARDSENEMTIKADGTKRNDEEIKDFIIAQNKVEGYKVERNEIFVITKAEMMRNLRAPADPNLPELKSNVRVLLTADGQVMVIEGKEKVGLKTFVASVNKPTGLINGKMDYVTLTRHMTGDKLNDATKKFIKEIDGNYIDKASIILRNLVVVKDGKEYIIKSEHKLSIP